MRFIALATLTVVLVAYAKEQTCAKQCDELMKSSAAACRKEAHRGDHGHEGGGNTCQAMLKSLRSTCLKKCESNERRKR